MRIQTDQYSKQIIVDETDIKYFIYRSSYVSIKDSISDDLKSYTPIFCNTFINGIKRKV
jgi:hypothetical protein